MLTVQVGDRTETPTIQAALPFDILWEDADLLILNKPAGLVVHGRTDWDGPTLAGAVSAYLGGPFHPVSRLDKGTGGVLCAAKSGYVHSLLIRQLHSPAYARDYLAVAEGVLNPPAGRIDLPIGRDPSSGVKRMVSPAGLPAVTDYETLATHDGLSLLRLRLHTGRTHQIRVHLAALGHPLVGDWLYGKEDPARISRPALHAYRLRLTHPVSGEEICCTAPLPDDFRSLLGVAGFAFEEQDESIVK